jgi:hypothetical protein
LIVFGWAIGFVHGKAKASYACIVTAWLKLPMECSKYMGEGNYGSVQSILSQELDEGIIQGLGLRRSVFLSSEEKNTIDGLLKVIIPLRENSASMCMRERIDPAFRQLLSEWAKKNVLPQTTNTNSGL